MREMAACLGHHPGSFRQLLRVLLAPRPRERALAAPEQAAAWQARLAQVRALLEGQPQAPMSWFWRMHLRVLGFLADRYLPGEPVAPPAARDEPPVVQRGTWVRVTTLPQELLPSPRPAGGRPDPATLAALSAHLQRIAAENLRVDKTPPPIILPPPLRRPPPLEAQAGAAPEWLILALVAGSWLIAAPILAVGILLGHTLMGIVVAIAFMLVALVVALSIDRV
jgi:hypothetical protein